MIKKITKEGKIYAKKYLFYKIHFRKNLAMNWMKSYTCTNISDKKGNSGDIHTCISHVHVHVLIERHFHTGQYTTQVFPKCTLTDTVYADIFE